MSGATGENKSSELRLKELELDYLVQALQSTKWRISGRRGAARSLSKTNYIRIRPERPDIRRLVAIPRNFGGTMDFLELWRAPLQRYVRAGRATYSFSIHHLPIHCCLRFGFGLSFAIALLSF